MLIQESQNRLICSLAEANPIFQCVVGEQQVLNGQISSGKLTYIDPENHLIFIEETHVPTPIYLPGSNCYFTEGILPAQAVFRGRRVEDRKDQPLVLRSRAPGNPPGDGFAQSRNQWICHWNRIWKGRDIQ